jgi:filamentous hemagglutinin family protein
MKLKSSCIILLSINSLSASAEVTLDGTLGRSGALPGPDYLIGADLGRQKGGNLFHSFQGFNLNRFESATFSGPNNVSNIISRVTGGNPSQIDGLIRSTIPNADMYFLNPYGIMFGPNAKLDVQGGFHASTADYLRLGDGGRFDVRYPNDSLLTIAPIESFGFLTDSPAPLSLEGSQLEISNGKIFSLIGGNLSITGAQIKAPAGYINLASVAEIGNVIPQIEDFVVPSLRGDMTISEQSLLDVSGEGGGSIFIRGGKFVVDNSTIAANTLGNQDGQQINIRANNVALLNSAKVTGDTLGAGKGTDIEVNAAGRITIRGAVKPVKNPPQNLGGVRQASTPAKDLSGFFARSGVNKDDKGKTLGDAGQINLQANNIEFGSASIASSMTYSTGNSGNIRLQTHHLQMQGTPNRLQDSKITTSTLAQGQGGNITILADNIDLISNASIESIASGKGDSGQIELQTRSLKMVSDEEGHNKVRTVTVGRGNAGNILIYADEMKLVNGGMINSTTVSSGNAGDIQVNVTGKLLISGQGQGQGGQKINTRISANANGRPGIQGWRLSEPVKTTGHGGKITIEAGELELRKGGQIQSISENISHSAGPSGDIIVRVQGTLLIHGVRPEDSPSQYLFNSGIYSNSVAGQKQADSAGNITLTAHQLVMQNGGIIRSDTNNSSAGGHIDIYVDTLDIDGKVIKPDLPTSGLYAGSSSPKTDAGTAGNIIIEADTIRLTNEGKMTTASQNAGGGNITLHNSGLLYLHNGTMTTSVHGGKGDGGNITIENPTFVVLNKGQIRAQADVGQGGNIYIKSGQFLRSNKSLVSASSKLGIDGKVKIDSPAVDMSGALFVLSSGFDIDESFDEPCKAALAGNSFVVQPIFGVPPIPSDWKANLLILLPISEEKTPPTVKNKGKTAGQSPFKVALLAGCQPNLSAPPARVGTTHRAVKRSRVIPEEQLF